MPKNSTEIAEVRTEYERIYDKWSDVVAVGGDGAEYLQGMLVGLAHAIQILINNN